MPGGPRARERLGAAPRGPMMIDVLETLSIEPEIADIAALAVVGHEIACLGADGTIEIVPVP